MKNLDLIRELEKIFHTLDSVVDYLETQNEANAKLHMSDKVMYSPLTSAAGLANKNLSALIMRLYDEYEKEIEDGSKEERTA
ncbi:hypothetical protein SEA_TUNATARTARE_6 [Streptomyces phage TunaTartare]|uniref:Uncharacterized protein n=1 Tax=Streptomyces phage TunaTartare TaxID=2848887 RepID=A0A8F2E6K1_9CAUD|nr:hypothetical protein PP457_gp006 [Streptomyces phage TunaTartare]QWT29902.1 hypothetical protein SEA_TUNATARTARE_6 [Streptomyces phage TunaTartare]